MKAAKAGFVEVSVPEKSRMISSKTIAGLLLCVAAGALAGCAESGAGAAQAMPVGQSCQSVRAELNRLDARGTQSKIESASRGAKLSPSSRADVDRYNQLLNVYLGAKCHN